MRMARCPRYGLEYPEGSTKYCAQCGWQLPVSSGTKLIKLLALIGGIFAFLMVAFIIIFILFAEPIESTEETEHTENTVIPGEIYEPVDEPVDEIVDTPTDIEISNYMTSGEWALTTPYAFAVEVEEYNGDVFEAGNYNFELIGGIASAQESLPALFGIYVSNRLYDNIAQLTQDFSDATFYVGGLDNASYQYELQAGQYVYIVPEELVLTPTGYLSFKKLK